MMMLSRVLTARPTAVSSASSVRRVRTRNDIPRGGPSYASNLSTLTTLHGPLLIVDRRSRVPSLPIDVASSSPLFQHQVRWKRKGGASAFSKPRPPTRNQRKRFNRRQREIYHDKVGRHSAPGSKAGPRRQAFEQRWEHLLNQGKADPNESQRNEYGYGHALLDDLIGNSSGLTSIPTPEPIYIGHRQRHYYNIVKGQMESYLAGQHQISQGEPGDVHQVAPSLPTDHFISLALRSYRDRRGTKNKPIGIAKALKYLLTNLSLPISAFREETYTTLVTCSRTPNEARRIFRLMKDNNHPISSYSWSILVDIHAKLGDPEGCDTVLKEMVFEGVAPSLPAYTSLIAACYKVCNAGHIPPTVRARAGKLGWQRWKEMRVVGLNPDVMAYGALLRLCAARGQPERAINVLEEMHAMEVKPTTLCFTSALRSVARSHETAIRYERGSSKKNMRRENVAAHHGKLTRDIVILAEVAEVEQDEGFSAALILCSAAAGDSATAKAIYLASEVRRMDHLRPIGSRAHLDLLKGPEALSGPVVDARPSFLQLQESSTGNNVPTLPEESASPALLQNSDRPSFGEREYGRDTRRLSALLHACSQALDMNGIGTMWAGRENKGFLCDNSLRLLIARPQPQYRDTSIPGLDPIEVGRGTVDWHDEPEVMGKRLRRAKFKGMHVDDSIGSTIDDIDPKKYPNLFDDVDQSELHHIDHFGTLEKFLQEKAHRAKVDASKATLREKEGDIDGHIDNDMMKRNDKQGIDPSSESASTSARSRTEDNASIDEDEWYFDNDVMKWKTRPFQKKIDDKPVNPVDSSSTSVSAKSPKEGTDAFDEEEWYFDNDVMKWKTRPLQKQIDDKRIEAADASSTSVSTTRSDTEGADTCDEEEWYFDDDIMRWKTRPRQKQENDSSPPTKNPITTFEANKLLSEQQEKLTARSRVNETRTAEEEFQVFYRDIMEEIRESGEDVQLNEEEARELFEVARVEYPELSSSWSDGDGRNETNDHDSELEKFRQSIMEEYGVDEDSVLETFHSSSDIQKTDSDKQLSKELESENQQNAECLSRMVNEGLSGEAASMGDSQVSKEGESNGSYAHSKEEVWKDDSFDGASEAELSDMAPATIEPEDGSSVRMAASDSFGAVSTFSEANPIPMPNETSDPAIAELQLALPGMPTARIEKIRNAFQKNLNSPSMLELVPLLRENMPDYISSGWLRKKNMQGAGYVMRKAEEEGTVDLHMLNSMLELKANAGSIDATLIWHDEHFSAHGKTPTAYSDRLVLQMLVRNNRLPRALAFKQQVNDAGRNLDALSYGSLIEYYARRSQLGSAMMLLKECVSVHGSPPGEKNLAPLRLLCRQNDMVPSMEALTGKDPLEWLRHGEANLKREMSKKGRRNVQYAMDRMVDA